MIILKYRNDIVSMIFLLNYILQITIKLKSFTDHDTWRCIKSNMRDILINNSEKPCEKIDLKKTNSTLIPIEKFKMIDHLLKIKIATKKKNNKHNILISSKYRYIVEFTILSLSWLGYLYLHVNANNYVPELIIYELISVKGKR